MAVIRKYTTATAKRPRIIGVYPMPDGSSRAFKGHTVAEVTRKWENAKEEMTARMQRKATRIRQISEYNRLRREVLAAPGICQDCGQADAEPGLTLCWSCRLYRNQRRSGARSAPLSPYSDGRRAG